MCVLLTYLANAPYLHTSKCAKKSFIKSNLKISLRDSFKEAIFKYCLYLNINNI